MFEEDIWGLLSTMEAMEEAARRVLEAQEANRETLDNMGSEGLVVSSF